MTSFEMGAVPEIKLNPGIHKHISPDSLVKVSAEKSTPFNLVFEYQGDYFTIDNLYGLGIKNPYVQLEDEYGEKSYEKLKTLARKLTHNNIVDYINSNGIDLPEQIPPYNTEQVSQAIQKITPEGGKIKKSHRDMYFLGSASFMVRDGVVYHQTSGGTDNYFPFGFFEYSDPKILNFLINLGVSFNFQQIEVDKAAAVRDSYEALRADIATKEVYFDNQKATNYFKAVLRQKGRGVSSLEKIFADLIRLGPEIVNNERKDGPQITKYLEYYIISLGDAIFKIEKTGQISCLKYLDFNPHPGFSGIRTVMDYSPYWKEIKAIDDISEGVRNSSLTPIGRDPIIKICEDIFGGLSSYTSKEGEYPMDVITND